MPGIFISYRRADSPDATGRIYDHLVAEFGRAKVFKDIDSIPLGRDFRSHLNQIVGDCAAVLAIVGPHWTDIRDEAGKRRLEDADDFVRIELEAALARNIPVVPVLVGHALMPGATQLPASLTQLAFRQSIEVRPDPDFHNDATRLVTALRRTLHPAAPEIDAVSSVVTSTGNATQVRPRPSRLAWSVAGVAVIAAMAMLLPTLRHLREPPPLELRTDIPLPAGASALNSALSPDGRQIVYSATTDGVSRLWLRPLAATTAQPLTGTEGAETPFWSPDGRSIAFFTGTALKRLDLGGGAPRTLAPVVGNRGGTWNADGVILFAVRTGEAIQRVSASGGPVSTVTKLGVKEWSHRSPFFLPDGNRFLYLVFGPEVAGIYLGALDGRVSVKLVAGGKSGVYLPSGWLLWERGGALVAQKLNLDEAKLTGGTLTLAEDIETQATRSVVSVAPGMIAYRPAASAQRQLVWFDRSGSARRIFGGTENVGFFHPRLSPDGQRVVGVRAGDLWLLDGTRTSRFTFDGAAGIFSAAQWSRDGTRIAWADSTGLHWKLASGAGTTSHYAVRLSDIDSVLDWSPDGRFLLYTAFDAATGGDLWVLPMVGDPKPSLFLKSRFSEIEATFSPDGRWVAYQSNESGQYEVYLRPFVAPGSADAASDTGASKWQVSTAGGSSPAWRRDGKELYYLSPTDTLIAVPIKVSGALIKTGVPVALFGARILNSDSAQLRRQYDIAPDDRFLVNTLSETASASMTLIQNWNPEGGNR